MDVRRRESRISGHQLEREGRRLRQCGVLVSDRDPHLQERAPGADERRLPRPGQSSSSRLRILREAERTGKAKF